MGIPLQLTADCGKQYQLECCVAFCLAFCLLLAVFSFCHFYYYTDDYLPLTSEWIGFLFSLALCESRLSFPVGWHNCFALSHHRVYLFIYLKALQCRDDGGLKRGPNLLVDHFTNESIISYHVWWMGYAMASSCDHNFQPIHHSNCPHVRTKLFNAFHSMMRWESSFLSSVILRVMWCEL